jgi:hypothetical protein
VLIGVDHNPIAVGSIWENRYKMTLELTVSRRGRFKGELSKRNLEVLENQHSVIMERSVSAMMPVICLR